MQFDELAGANFPNMSLQRFSHRGQSAIPDEIYMRACNVTRRLIDGKFGNDIGQDAQTIRFHACVLEMKTTTIPGSVKFSLNSLMEGLEGITLNCVSKFTQRDGAAFVELKLPNGVRQLVFNPVPFKFPAWLVLNSETNAVEFELFFVRAPPNTKFYMCFGEIETFRCVQCSVCAETMRKCVRCKSPQTAVRYCSKECQLAHWPVHRTFCCK
jgi:hypothetical protein